MSPAESPQALSPMMEQARLVNEAAAMLLQALPDEWDRAVLAFRALTTSAEDALTIYRGSNATRDFPPEDTADLLFELRRVMFVPGAGTWLSMELEVTPDGRTATRFNYDDEPVWALQPDDATYVEDLAQFPREPEHIPAWLQERLGHAGAVSRGEVEPEWIGLRFQASFTPTGGMSASTDFQPAPGAHQWAAEVVAALTAEGITARVGEDVDEESDVRFPQVTIELGQGYCALAFWAEQVFWSVDVAASQADLQTARRVVVAVRAAVERVTGWAFVDAKVTTAYERGILGLQPH